MSPPGAGNWLHSPDAILGRKPPFLFMSHPRRIGFLVALSRVTACPSPAEPTRKEVRSTNYNLHIPTDSPANFYENWNDKPSLDARMQTPQIKELLLRGNELCAEDPSITTWGKIA